MVTAEERIQQATEIQKKRIERIAEEMREEGYIIESEEEVYKLFPKFLRLKIEEAGEREAHDWTLKAVQDYIYACRVNDYGNPAFQMKYAGAPFKKEKVLIKCIGGKQLVANHQWFRKMPPEFRQLLEKGSWEDFARWMYDNNKLSEKKFLAMLDAPFVMRWTKEMECPSPPEEVVVKKETKKKR